MDHEDKDQDREWCPGGMVRELPYGEENELQALHLWDKTENQVVG